MKIRKTRHGNKIYYITNDFGIEDRFFRHVKNIAFIPLALIVFLPAWIVIIATYFWAHFYLDFVWSPEEEELKYS